MSMAKKLFIGGVLHNQLVKVEIGQPIMYAPRTPDLVASYTSDKAEDPEPTPPLIDVYNLEHRSFWIGPLSYYVAEGTDLATIYDTINIRLAQTGLFD